jgi:Leucine rich repeat/Protein kinase domain
VLFCSGNPFTELPAVLGLCPSLEMVGFKSCQIARIPDDALPAQLRWLILTDNRIESLPASIGRCSRLQKLMLAGNRLRELPPELAGCVRLELLRISANRLQALPDWLGVMPRLSWLAFGGNPLNAALEAEALARADGARFDWSRLQLQEQLGEGASGVIHRAMLADGTAPREIALKRFKGDVTSDGLPESEMAAWLHAGEQPGLVPVLGQVSGHPDGAQRLAMPLIGPAFSNLAGPPSLESCTRDCYALDSRFGIDEIAALARGIALTAAHLHQRGILHGDLYGHNILHDGKGRARLGDFGAASLFRPGHAAALQRIEARAFGCLLEELLERCPDPDDGRLSALEALRDDCLADAVARRPLFTEILRRLP